LLILPITAAADFSAADLAGTWYGHALVAGDEPGWEESVLTIDSEGGASFSSNESGGEQYMDEVTVTVSDKGIVKVAEASAIEGVMSMDKDLIVLTETPGEEDFMLNIFIRAEGSFDQSDLAGTWHGHSLITGSETGWQRSTLVLDNSGEATFSSVDSEGRERTNERPGRLVLSEEGIITPLADLSLHGAITPDKNLMVATETADAEEYILHVFVREGEGFQQADLAGTWYAHSLYTGEESYWERATVTVDEAGGYTWQWQDAYGASGTDSGSVLLSESGILTVDEAADLHGVLSIDKGLIALTNTETNGVYQLSVITAWAAGADGGSGEVPDDDEEDDEGGGSSGCFIQAADPRPACGRTSGP
jgi:hypothetical protein